MKPPKTILAALFGALFLAGLFASQPVFAQASAWTDAECAKAGGTFASGNCYAQPASVELGVSIGGLTQANLSQYLATAYRMGLGIAAVLAVIFIMIGGFRYLAAAGGGQVEEGKGMIKNAIIGLILAILSYTLLQTVNPNLTALQLPPVKMVKSKAMDTAGKTSSMAKGSACWTGSDQEACKAACDGCVCKVLQDPPAAKIVEGIAAVSISIGALPALAVEGAAAAVGSGVLKILGTSGRAVWSATKLVWGAGSAVGGTAGGVAAVGATGVAAGAELASLWGDKGEGERGVCLPFANHDIPKGGLCSDNDGCISGDCRITSESLGVGICIVKDGTLDSFCDSVSDCSKVTGTVRCVETRGGDGKVKLCANGEFNSACGVDADCNTGVCGYKGICVASAGTAALGAKCSGSDECASKECAIPGNKTNDGICVTGQSGGACFKHADCKGAGLVCLSPTAHNTQTEQGYCVAKTADGECYTDDQCTTGHHCKCPGQAYGPCKVTDIGSCQ